MKFLKQSLAILLSFALLFGSGAAIIASAADEPVVIDFNVETGSADMRPYDIVYGDYTLAFLGFLMLNGADGWNLRVEPPAGH